MWRFVPHAPSYHHVACHKSPNYTSLHQMSPGTTSSLQHCSSPQNSPQHKSSPQLPRLPGRGCFFEVHSGNRKMTYKTRSDSVRLASFTEGTDQFSRLGPSECTLKMLQSWRLLQRPRQNSGNYPYPSSFLAPLPAWPMAAACEKVLNATQPIQGASWVGLIFHL